MRRTKERGSVLTVVVILILILSFLTLALSDGARAGSKRVSYSESKYKARMAALSGLYRAIAELNGSIAGTCSHGATNGPCYGNIDGNISNANITASSGFQLSTFATTGPTCMNKGTTITGDTYDIDNNATATDGFTDFRGQTSSTANIGIAWNDANGNYSVRSKGVGQASGSVYSAYKIRSYGVWKGQVACFEAIVESKNNPGNAFNAGVTANGQIQVYGNDTTNSWKSGYPPDSGVTYVGPPSTYTGSGGATNPNNGHGDVATNANVNIFGGSSIVHGSVQASSVSGGYTGTATIAPNQVTISPLTLPTATGTDVSSTFNTTSGTSLGSSGSPLSTASYQTSSIALSGHGVVDIYVANSATITIFVNGNISLTGSTAQIAIHQPATGLPGTVKFIDTSATATIDVGGNGILNSDATSSPSNCQILSNTTGTVSIHGNGAYSGIVAVPNAYFNVSGSANFYGAAIAQSADIHGSTGGFYYDMSLKNIQLNGNPVYRIFSLIELTANSRAVAQAAIGE